MSAGDLAKVLVLYAGLATVVLGGGYGIGLWLVQTGYQNIGQALIEGSLFGAGISLLVLLTRVGDLHTIYNQEESP